MKSLLFFCLACLIATTGQCQSNQSVSFYVAASGQSGNPGTMDRPFASPMDAWNAIKAMQGSVTATVYMRTGIYPFSKGLLINDPQKTVTFTAYQNDKVQFTGGVRLDDSRFTVTRDELILNRLPSAARGKVMEIDLKQAGITDYGKMVPHGYKMVRNAPLELFYNDSALPVARYPNTGYMPIGQVVDHGSNPRNGEKPDRGGKFIFDNPHINNWGQAANAWVAGYFSYGYSDDYLPIEKIDVGARTIQLGYPSLYTIFSTDDVSNDMLKNSQKIRGFYVYNLLEELDSPGEWYLDVSTGKLYLWPPDNAISGADIQVSLLEEPIVTLIGTKNITFTGISFGRTRGAAIVLKNTANTKILHCEISNTGTYGINASGQGDSYNSNLLVSNCSIFNTGTGGILLEGGDRKTLTPGNNVVDNCDIYNFSRINRTFSYAVAINGVGNKVTHCNIYDAPDGAIGFFGNDHVISYNHFRNLDTYMTDAGAVGTGRDIGTTGNVIDHNFFENIQSEVGGSVCAIYLDDGSSGMEVNGNIFYHCGTPGSYHFGAVHIHGGSDNEFKNNQFIDCHQAFSFTPLSDDQWKDVVSNPGIEKSFRPGVDIHSAPYAKYKPLARLTAPGQAPARVNNITNTLAYKVDVMSAGGGNSIVEKNTVNETSDPGFANMRKRDFNLTAAPAALRNAPDWKAVPFSEIGRHKQ